MKRIFWLFAVNLLIMITLSIAAQVISSFFGFRLGGGGYLVILYGMIGMGGALINLALSRIIAKSTMGVQVISINTQNPSERRLLDMVRGLAQKAGLPEIPEVGIYPGEEVNAFATGPSQRRALVAVSTGLLQRMDEAAIEGVLGHEVAHIANGDMVTMTLIQGVINTMVLIAARLIANLVSSQVEERSRWWVEMAVFYGMQIVLSLFGTMVVCYFSRRREFRADAGGARYAGREQMLRGLNTLGAIHIPVDMEHKSLATLKISGPPSGMLALFATHPPLEERIRRLEK